MSTDLYTEVIPSDQPSIFMTVHEANQIDHLIRKLAKTRYTSKKKRAAEFSEYPRLSSKKLKEDFISALGVRLAGPGASSAERKLGYDRARELLSLEACPSGPDTFTAFSGDTVCLAEISPSGSDTRAHHEYDNQRFHRFLDSDHPGTRDYTASALCPFPVK